MWLGEQVTEKGIGNGISLLIFAGIVAGLPGAIGQSAEAARQGDLNILGLLAIGIIAVGVVAFVVFMERAQRRITVNYARRQQGNKVYAAQQSHLPLKIKWQVSYHRFLHRACCYSLRQLVSGLVRVRVWNGYRT